MKELVKKIENFKGSPVLAAVAAILLVIMSVSLAVSCGGEESPPATPSKAETKPAGATGTNRSTATTTDSTPLAPTTDGYSVSGTGDSLTSAENIWKPAFKTKNPFYQQLSKTSGTTGTTGTTGTNGTTGTTGTSTAPYSGSTGSTTGTSSYTYDGTTSYTDNSDTTDTTGTSGTTGTYTPPPVK